MDTIHCRKLSNFWIVVGAVLSLLIAAVLGGLLFTATILNWHIDPCSPNLLPGFMKAFGVLALFVAPLLLSHALFLRWYNIRRHAPTWMVWLPVLLAALAFGMVMIAEFSEVLAAQGQCSAAGGEGGQSASSAPVELMLWVARLCLVAVPLASLFALLVPSRAFQDH